MDNLKDREIRFSKAEHIIGIGFGINAVLMIMKLFAGYYGNSEAVFADGLESACDFIAMTFTMVALKIGRKTFDEDHPYGHGKVECIAAIIVSLIIFAAGGTILFQAVTTFVEGSYPRPQFIAVCAAAVTILAKEILYRYTHGVAQELESPAVEAIAKDHHKDALTSIATLIGVTGAYCGVAFLDPLAAGLTSIFIFYIGWETLRKAGHDLMDGQPPQNILQDISAAAREISGVDHVHEIRGRRSGQYLIIDLKLEMDPNMTVKKSHDIATNVKRHIFNCFPNVGDVMIHVNPSNEDHDDLIRL